MEQRGALLKIEVGPENQLPLFPEPEVGREGGCGQPTLAPSLLSFR